MKGRNPCDFVSVNNSNAKCKNSWFHVYYLIVLRTMTSCEFMHKLYLKSTDIGRSVAPWLQTVESIFVHFCRAMLYKRGLCRHAVSVCLSVRHVREFCQNDEIYLQFFSPSGSHTILFFSHQTPWRYSDNDLHNGGVEYRWAVAALTERDEAICSKSRHLFKICLPQG